MRKLVERFLIQWTLLTRIPIPSKWHPVNFNDPTSLAFAPLVGVIVGLLCGAIGMIISRVINAPIAAWVTLGLYISMGWSLHLDGWSDFADGIGSGRRGEELRLIMKDSRIGAFGSIALIWAVGLWWISLCNIHSHQWPMTLALSGGFGRFGICVAALFGKYPWSQGMGLVFVRHFDFRKFLYCIPFLLLVAFCAPFYSIQLLPLSFMLSGASVLLANKLLGGVSGDILGATEVLCELSSLALLSGITR